MKYCLGCMEEIEDNVQFCPNCGYREGTPVAEAYYLEPGIVLNQRFLVGKVLGYGGFGVTYIGRDMILNRIVAVKEYFPSELATRGLGSRKMTIYSGDARGEFQAGLKSFLSEAKRLAQIHNIDGIVHIYDCFQENDTGYIVMEFLKGKTIKEILAERKKIPYAEAEEIVKAVLETLAEVHKEGIIHRDIAPDNIFITDDRKVKILDFGAARYAASAKSRSLSVILKPGYAPEEQYRSHGAQGPWTDVYGVGATFYRMITGTKPEEAIERSIEDLLLPPSRKGVNLSPDLEKVLMKSLSVRSKDRYQSAGEFLAALNSCGAEKRAEEKNGKTEKSEKNKFGRSMAPGTGGNSGKKKGWIIGTVAGVAALAAVGIIFVVGKGKISDVASNIAMRNSTVTSVPEPTETIEPTTAELTAVPEPTAEPTPTPEPTATPTPEPTATPTPEPTATATPEPTATPTPEPTATPTPEPTATPTPEPTATPTPEPTATPTPEPTATPTPEPTATPTPEPTATPGPELTTDQAAVSAAGTGAIYQFEITDGETTKNFTVENDTGLEIQEMRFSRINGDGEADYGESVLQTGDTLPMEITKDKTYQIEIRDTDTGDKYCFYNVDFGAMTSLKLCKDQDYTYIQYVDAATGEEVSLYSYRIQTYAEPEVRYTLENSLRVRNLPDTEKGQVLESYSASEEITVYGQAYGMIDGAKMKWYLVQSGEQYGFISADGKYTSKEKPATPTPAPTSSVQQSSGSTSGQSSSSSSGSSDFSWDDVDFEWVWE